MIAPNRDDKPTHCPLCMGKGIVHEGPRRISPDKQLDAFEGLDVYICESCGFGFAYPQPDAEASTRYYEDIYRPRHYEKIEKGQWPIPDTRSIAQLYLAQLFCKFNNDDVFLDVGVGVGASLTSAQMILNRPSLAIVEKNMRTIDFLKKEFPSLKIFSDIENAKKSKINAKIVLMSHSLEHFYANDILGLIKEIRSILDEDGVFVIEVPHCDYRAPLFNKGKADALHISFFSVDSFHRMAENCKLNILYIDTFSHPKNMSRIEHNNERRISFNKAGMRDEKTINLAKTLRNGFFLPVKDGSVIRAVLSCNKSA